MMKKIVIGSLLMGTFLSANAITIENNNSKSVKYTIGDGPTCVTLEYTKGELSPGGQVIWTGNTFYHPSKVCVHAGGWSSIIGVFAYNVKNDNCIVTISNAGFMRGIKISTSAGC